MTLLVELTLRNPILFEPTFEQAPDAICEFADFHHVSEDDRHGYVFFWWVRGTDRETFDAAITADDTVAHWDHIVDFNERHLYRIETALVPHEQALVFPTFRDLNITVLESTRTLAGLELRIRVPDRSTVRTFIDTADTIARETTVHRLYVESAEVEPLGALTERQREVLEVAYAAGYFATPRECSLTDLAEELDVTTQTLSRHLRLAVETVLERTIAHP